MKITTSKNPNATRCAPGKRLLQTVGASIRKIGPWLQQQISNQLPASPQEDESAARVLGAPVVRCKLHVYIWLAHFVRRLRESNTPLRNYRISLISLLLAVIFAYFTRTIFLGSLSLCFLGAVVISAETGGMRAGLLTTILSLFPCGWILHLTLPASREGEYVVAALGLFIPMALVTCILSDNLYVARQEEEKDRVQAETQAQRSRFLAEASAMLDSSHDYETVLTQVTRAIVPVYADWAAIDMLDKTGRLSRIAATHPDPALEAVLREIDPHAGAHAQEDGPLWQVLRTRQGKIIEEGCASLWASLLGPDADLDQHYALAPRALLCVPLTTRGRVLGMITFGATSEHRYRPTDLVVARDLALRVALAVDNLRLYHEAQQEIVERKKMEQQIRDYSNDLDRQRRQLAEINAQLVVQAVTDGLTGMNNHRSFQETLSREIERSQRYSAPLSLLMLDVDHFKQYNDTYGHPVGDQVLQLFAGVLKANARDTDFVARYGGEEFVVILPETDAHGAVEVAQRLRNAIETAVWPYRPVTASFGAATLPQAIATASELISWADKALYRSKQEGRNCVTHAETLIDLTKGAAVVLDSIPAVNLSPTLPADLPQDYEAVLGTRTHLAGRRNRV